MAVRLTIGWGLISIKAHYDLGSLALGLVHRLALKFRMAANGEWKVFLVFWPGIPLKSLRLGEFGLAQLGGDIK